MQKTKNILILQLHFDPRKGLRAKEGTELPLSVRPAEIGLVGADVGPPSGFTDTSLLPETVEIPSTLNYL